MPAKKPRRQQSPVISQFSPEEVLQKSINTTVLDSIQKAIQTTSCHATQRKVLLRLLIRNPNANDIKGKRKGKNKGNAIKKNDDDDNGVEGEGEVHDSKEEQQEDPLSPKMYRNLTIQSIRNVVLNRIPLQTPPDTLKRYTSFIRDLCNNYCREMKATTGEDNDDLPISLVEVLVEYHNSKDKGVRLMVCTMLHALLGTLCESIPRDALYFSVATALKERAFDKCPLVREKAVCALRAFHLGEKEDDVTQVALAIMCEDGNHKVREAAVLCPPRYRSVHLRHILRMTQDVNASVRRACWESLSKYDIKDQLLNYAAQLRIDMFQVAMTGLEDESETVKNACRTTISTAWLLRGFNGNIQALLDAFFVIPLTPSQSDAVAVTMFLLSCNKASITPFVLDTSDITVPKVLHWKCSVMYFSENGSIDHPQHHSVIRGEDCGLGDIQGAGLVNLSPEDDAFGLPVVAKFYIILTSVVNQYADRPNPVTKEGTRMSGQLSTLQYQDVKLADNSNGMFIIDLLLSVFDLYNDQGTLGHADDTMRNHLNRPLNFLLKVVTLHEPSCFVDASVKAILAITSRHEGEGKNSIESALRMLFSLLSIPKMHDLSYEDVEAYGRYDYNRRRKIELLAESRQETGADMLIEGSEEHKLFLDVTQDDAVLYRMIRIAHAYLSFSERGSDAPLFISHIIQLARAQNYISVSSLAFQCLTLQCMMSPQVVSTFLPIFVKEAMYSTTQEVSRAAVGGLFDLLGEYGNKFFDVSINPPGCPQPALEEVSDDEATASHSLQDACQIKDENKRRKIEKFVASEDTHKPGSQVLTRQLMTLLQSPNQEIRSISLFGFCKLLAMNRLLPEAIPFTIARLFLFLIGTDNSSDECQQPSILQLHRVIETFFRSYSYSHPKRQANVLEGGLIAFRLALNEYVIRSGESVVDGPPKVIVKLLKRIVTYTDAINLQQVRDVDPELSVRVAQQTALEVSRISGGSIDTSMVANKNNSFSSRSSTTRLWRELGKHSLHERLALELIVDAGHYRQCDCILRLILGELPLLRLYKRDSAIYKNMQNHADDCIESIKSGASNHVEGYIDSIKEFIEGASKINAAPLDGSDYYLRPEEEALLSPFRISYSKRLSTREYTLELSKKILLTSENTCAQKDQTVPVFFDSKVAEESLSQGGSQAANSAFQGSLGEVPSATLISKGGNTGKRPRSSSSVATQKKREDSIEMDREMAALLKGTLTKRRRR